MESSSGDQIARLLRLKRYELPPPGYFEDFLHEFRRRRQRDESLRQSLWRMCFESARDFALRLDVRPWAYAGVAVVVACAALILLLVYQEPNTTQFAVQSSPVPSTPPNTENDFDFAPPTLDIRPALLPGGGDVWLVPVDSFRSDQFAPLNLEWDSRDDPVSATEIEPR
jgi:hypothetical protein